MEHIPDNIRNALLQLSDAAVRYLFPDLRRRDLHRMLDREETPIRFSRSSPTKSTGSGICFSRKMPRRPEPEDDQAEYEAGLFDKLMTEEEEYAIVENELRVDDERGQKIRADIAKILDKYQVSALELRTFLDAPTQISRLKITHRGRILLTSFDDREVKMDPLSKVVFILYLRHPEGIAFMDLWSHEAEMLEIYGHLSRRSDLTGMMESISRLCFSVEDNSINEKVSRIKRAFLNVVDENIASMYYIKGPAGGVKSIELPRDLVKIQL